MLTRPIDAGCWVAHAALGWMCATALAGCGTDPGTSAERQVDGGGAASGAGGSGGAGGWATNDAAAGGPGADAGDAAAPDGGGCVTATANALPFASADWNDYDPATYLTAGYYLDAKGDVQLEGLITKVGGTPVQGDVIGTLPDGHRPAARLVFSAYAKGYGRVDVNSSGEILWVQGNEAEKDYVSLARISFRPGSSAVDDWTAPALGTWLDYGSSYSPAAYRKDAADEVHLRGLIKKTGATSGETIFTLPDAHRPSHRLLFLVASGGGTAGRIDVDPDGRVIWYPGSSSYVSLSGVSFHVAPTQFELAALEGTWTDYGGTHAPAGYYKDCFGRVHLRGLVTESAGTPAQSTIFTLPAGHRPQARVIFAVGTRVASAAAPTTGRVDVHPDGRVVWMGGGTYEKDWTSLSGLSFVAAN